jgi:glycosyltransferase involved in cell wall biosynthesis
MTGSGGKVSLVATVRNAGGNAPRFLASVAAQLRPPDEVVIVDGGSTDGTLEELRSAAGITLIEEPGANIARGRNVAIAAASHDVIAVSDADCVLDPGWLDRLTRVIEGGADVAMGAYQPVTDGFLQTCMAAVNLPDPSEWDEATFTPSSRSVAFRRSAIEAAGGYPEWLDIGEDMYVDHRWRELGLEMRLARDATVLWTLRPTLRETWVQYFRYGRGDAIAGMHAERHALRFAVYGGAMYAWGSRGIRRKLATVAGGIAYASRPLRRAMNSFGDPLDRARALVAVPALMTFVDAAKMAGYLTGLPRSAGTRPGG